MNNEDAPIAAVADYRGPAAARDRRAAAGFPDLRNRRFRAAIYLAAWGVAAIISTTVPDHGTNPDHVMVCFLILMSGVLLLLLSMAAADLPWLEGAAARLEGLLRDIF